jgi:hypothetical protein
MVRESPVSLNLLAFEVTFDLNNGSLTIKLMFDGSDPIILGFPMVAFERVEVTLTVMGSLTTIKSMFDGVVSLCSGLAMVAFDRLEETSVRII